MKHTPGPWHVKHWPASANGIIPEAFSIEPGIARIYDGDTKEANARLIAKAPELLDALRDLVNRADNTEVAGAGYSLDTAWAHGLLHYIEEGK